METPGRLLWSLFFAFVASSQGQQDRSALTLNKQALDAAAHSDYAGAERLFGEALKIWRSLGPRYEAHTATTLANLGEMLCSSGKWREGAGALVQALELNRRSLGPKHIRTVSNLGLLGHAYLNLADLNRAETGFTEALAIERELYPNHIPAASTLLGISLLRRRQGRFDEALQAGEEGLQAALQAAGEADVGVAMAYENVATLHLLAGRPERALPLFRSAHVLYEKTLGPASPALASLLSQEGLALLNDGKVMLAAIEMTQAADMLRRMGPAGEYRLAIAETNLAVLRLRQHNLAEVERLITHALSIEDAHPAQPAYDLIATIGVLAELRKAQRRDAEAAELMARLVVIQSSPR
uniref:TPR repeat-containing protein n=1 Tax=Solibacter usitatus (strain Ellin6076) TaxID=234267 RepID=Q02AN9_SOLUE